MKIPVVLGPTSTGKTGFSLWLSKKIDGEIISADSRQIYKYLDVGTGKKPLNKDVSYEKHDSCWVMEGVPIWGYDLITPDERFSAYDFAKVGLGKLNELLLQKKRPVIAGGTGLYIDFLTGKYKDMKGAPDPRLRKKLEKKSLEQLRREAMSLNLELNRSDFHNPVRLVRIIERNKSTKTRPPLPYPTEVSYVFMGLKSSRDFLYSRVDSWVQSIWWNDLILKEIENVWDLGYKDSFVLSGLVYKSAIAHLENEKIREEAIRQTQYNLHAYVRRQLTYFRKDSRIKWFDIAQDNWYENIYNYYRSVPNG